MTAQITKIEKHLRKNTKGSGITVAKLAKAAGVPKDNVYKRVHDLRAEGIRIYSNYRNVNGERKMYYLLAS